MAATEIRTYASRQGRLLRTRRRDALQRLLPEYGGLEFDRPGPLVLEIGSGMGDHTAAMAAADPGRNYLAAEVHAPGVANLLLQIEEHGLTNLRVVHSDALPLLRERLVPDSLAAAYVLFPDPWPKNRHHKRRLLQSERVALVRSRLARGGTLHVATDWPDYARQIERLLAADPGLVAVTGQPPADRPVTRYELLALAAGR
jgi:tRNA (guanine-N7-)-methyltransferase